MMEYYTIAVIAILAAISPGPDFVVVVKNALSHDRKSALITSLGVSLGTLVHSTYCILGLAIIISKSILLFNMIKYLGASYLIYLGVKSLLSKEVSKNPMNAQFKHSSITNSRSFLDGFFTNVLNPKCTLFMLSVFTLVVKPNTPIGVQSIYALEIAVATLIWFVFLSYALTHKAIKKKVENVQHVVSKVIGVVLLGLGISILVKR